MEAQFTIRDTLDNFRNWVNSYHAAHMGRYDYKGPFGWDPYTEDSVYTLDCLAYGGHVVFRVQVVNPEWLIVQALTHWGVEDEDTERRRHRQEALDAYFTKLARAIRLKWEPVSLTVTELYEQSFRRLEGGEKPIDVFRDFYLPNLPEWEQPKDASQAADIHNAWKSAMSARRRKKRKQGKG